MTTYLGGIWAIISNYEEKKIEKKDTTVGKLKPWGPL